MKKVARSATPIMDMYLEKSGEMLQMPVLRRTFGFCVHLDRPCWYIEHSNLSPMVDLGPHLISATVSSTRTSHASTTTISRSTTCPTT